MWDEWMTSKFHFVAWEQAGLRDMVRAMVRLIALVLLPSLCCLAAEVKKPSETPGEFPIPKDGKPWRHAESGVQLPQELGHMTMVSGFRYETPELGLSIRYENAETRAKADVYVYPCGRPHADPEQRMQAGSDEAGAALGEIKEMERRGRYSKVDFGEAESRTVKASVDEKGESAFIEVPISYVLNEDEGTGVASTAVRSRLGLAVMGDYYVKVRYTYSADSKDEGKTASEEWFKKVRMVLSEPYLRSVAEDSLKKYFKDPLSAEGIDAAGGVVVYAEVSPFVSLLIPSELTEWGEACEKQAPEAGLHFLRAYIAGAVKASLEGEVGDDVLESAMAGLAQVYALLKKKHPGLKVEGVEEMVKAVAEKKGAAFFKTLDSVADRYK